MGIFVETFHNGFSNKFREEMIRGYMSNSELETAIKDFGWRCANVSRIYRYMMYTFLPVNEYAQSFPSIFWDPQFV